MDNLRGKRYLGAMSSNAVEVLEKGISINAYVAGNVRAELSRERWSGRSAANALEVPRAYLARRLSGEVPFEPDLLYRLAVLTHVPVGKFFELPDLDSNQEPID